jgi:H+/Cl- antiporter ClcA
MTTELTILSTWWEYWPVAVAAVFAPLLGSFLARWLPFPFAIGMAAFVSWTFVGVAFARRWQPKWGLPRWLAAILVGVAPGLCLGLLAFFFPWK